MTIFEELTNNIIIHPEQGYAMFYYHNGECFQKVNGLTGENNSPRITLDSYFRLASVTKQFMAFGIVRLVKENKLTYDTIVKNIFKELPDYFNNITIKHLLNHTSGIYDYEDLEHDDTDSQIQDQDVFQFLKNTNTTYFEPGSKYRYSNTAYILLGLIIEEVTQTTLGNYYQTIFKEAKMDYSVVNYQGQTSIVNRAYGHLIVDGQLVVKDQYWCSATIGDGGIYSSVNDLKKWCDFLSNSQEFLDMKVPNYISSEDYNEYGLGLRIIKIGNSEIIYHCGDTIGTNTLLLFSIDLNLCLIFLTNMGNIDTTIMKDNLLKILVK